MDRLYLGEGVAAHICGVTGGERCRSMAARRGGMNQLASMSDRLSRAVTPDESRGLLDTSVVIDSALLG